jgi:ubiquinone/menaquinone biosynthesis C-methylase UbiE
MDKLLSEETHWEMAAKTRMGKYLTLIESNFIFNSVGNSEMHIIMDVGAEAGRFSLLAAGKSAVVIGIDIDNYSLNRLRRKNKEISLIQADARNIPLCENLFDAVFMIQVLDYIPELDDTFRECHRTLKPGAPFFFSFGNSSSLKSVIRKFRGKSYMHSCGEVLRVLAQMGFSVKKKMGYSWLPFGRTSESKFVPILSGMERILGLRKLPSLSPWVIIYAVKSS